MKDRIKEIRTRLNLTQAEFALRIGRTAGYISNLETGFGRPSEETIHRIINEYNVNDLWLRSGKGEMFSKEIKPTEETSVGERIKKARKYFNLTQTEFASRIGYHVNQVHYVEIGKVKPSSEFLYKTAKEFNLSYKWLMTGEGEMMGFRELTVTDKMLDWLNEHPDIIFQLQQRSGID